MATYSYKGVEYEFVDTEKKLLDEVKCPICWELVSDPVQTSCGHLFCGECITGTSTCPVDRKQFTSYSDKFNDRRLRNFKVKCPKKERGCQWQGNLGDVDKHTSVNCDYATVKCYNTDCRVKVERTQLVNHMQNECLQRMYKCPYCNKEDTYLTVTTTHCTICEGLPLPCPSGCGRLGLVRKNIAHHLSADCPDELVPCTFAIAGCQEIVKRKDLQQHLQDKDRHLDASQQVSLTLPVQDFTYGSSTIIPLLLRHWLQNTPTCYPRPLWVLNMDGFQERMGNNEVWFSDPVYSHFGGYKMCLCVYANGQRYSKGTHVSVYVNLMQGNNDDNLKWPFRGTIKVSLLNQLEDKHHHTRQPWSPGDGVSEDISGRVTEGERVLGWGQSHFISHEELNYKGDKNCQYLKDNTLYFRIDCISPQLD